MPDSDHFYSALFYFCSDAALVVDGHGRLVDASAEACKLVGDSLTDLIIDQERRILSFPQEPSRTEAFRDLFFFLGGRGVQIRKLKEFYYRKRQYYILLLTDMSSPSVL